MIRFFLKTTLRSIFRQKVYSIINILGLAIGLAAFILTMLWVEDELSYEKSHENADNTFIIFKGYSMGGKTEYNPSLCYPLGPHLKENFPEIKTVVRVVGAHKPGDSIKLTVFRAQDQAESDLTVTLGEHPDKKGQAYLGVQLSRFLRMQKRFDGDRFEFDLEIEPPEFDFNRFPDDCCERELPEA